MARVIVSEVRGVLTTEQSDNLTDAQIQSAIDAATIIVDRLADADCHTSASLKQVELYLSAHIAVQTTGGGQLKKEKIGDASEERSSASDGSSNYLQTAYLLDCSGLLVNFMKQKVQFSTFGAA